MFLKTKSGPLLLLRFYEELGYKGGQGGNKKSETYSGDHYLIYITTQEKKKMFLKAFFQFFTFSLFFIGFVLEDPVYMYNINKTFK